MVEVTAPPVPGGVVSVQQHPDANAGAGATAHSRGDAVGLGPGMQRAEYPWGNGCPASVELKLVRALGAAQVAPVPLDPNMPLMLQLSSAHAVSAAAAADTAAGGDDFCTPVKPAPPQRSALPTPLQSPDPQRDKCRRPMLGWSKALHECQTAACCATAGADRGVQRYRLRLMQSEADGVRTNCEWDHVHQKWICSQWLYQAGGAGEAGEYDYIGELPPGTCDRHGLEHSNAIYEAFAPTTSSNGTEQHQRQHASADVAAATAVGDALPKLPAVSREKEDEDTMEGTLHSPEGASAADDDDVASFRPASSPALDRGSEDDKPACSPPLDVGRAGPVLPPLRPLAVPLDMAATPQQRHTVGHRSACALYAVVSALAATGAGITTVAGISNIIACVLISLQKTNPERKKQILSGFGWVMGMWSVAVKEVCKQLPSAAASVQLFKATTDPNGDTYLEALLAQTPRLREVNHDLPVVVIVNTADAPARGEHWFVVCYEPATVFTRVSHDIQISEQGRVQPPIDGLASADVASQWWDVVWLHPKVVATHHGVLGVQRNAPSSRLSVPRDTVLMHPVWLCDEDRHGVFDAVAQFVGLNDDATSQLRVALQVHGGGAMFREHGLDEVAVIHTSAPDLSCCSQPHEALRNAYYAVLRAFLAENYRRASNTQARPPASTLRVVPMPSGVWLRSSEDSSHEFPGMTVAALLDALYMLDLHERRRFYPCRDFTVELCVYDEVDWRSFDAAVRG